MGSGGIMFGIGEEEDAEEMEERRGMAREVAVSEDGGTMRRGGAAR